MDDPILSEPEYRIFKKIDKAHCRVLVLRKPEEIEAFDRLVSLGYLEQKSNGFYSTLDYRGKERDNGRPVVNEKPCYYCSYKSECECIKSIRRSFRFLFCFCCFLFGAFFTHLTLILL